MSTPTDFERLRELLVYDPESGIFTWKPGQHHKRRGRAGFLDEGYRKITIEGVAFREHHVAFAMMMGRWPRQEVDHRNTIKDDNRWENLRECTHAQNLQNLTKARSDSRSGLMGIRLQRDGKWWARIQVDGKRKSLGVHTTKEQAHQAYLDAKRELHPFSTL